MSLMAENFERKFVWPFYLFATPVVDIHIKIIKIRLWGAKLAIFQLNIQEGLIFYFYWNIYKKG